MPITYRVKAAIINESKSPIQRLAAKITQVTEHSEEDYIKTYPLLMHTKNRPHLSWLQHEISPYRQTPFLGINFLSYGIINFIHFTSTFKSFQLDKGDHITFHFENEDPLIFHFHSPKTSEGYFHKNIHPIKDMELSLLKKENLEFWEITNNQQQSIVGGFTYNEGNKQYKSPKIGQKLFHLMAQNILIAKEQLHHA